MTEETASSPHTLQPGTSFGRYRIVRFLGRGGMGEVYEGLQEDLQLSYALKLIPSDLASRKGFLDRFRQEARVMARLEHPHVMRVDDFGQTNGRYWMRMPLVEGVADGHARRVSLEALSMAAGGRLNQWLVARILSQVLDALVYAHGLHVIHRDLKPANILLEGEDLPSVRVRIGDFGLVRLVGEEWLMSRTLESVTLSSSLGGLPTVGEAGDEGTSTRALLGTYAYMSPEQKRGEAVDQRSDLYAVGLMAFRLLTGRWEPGFKPPSRIEPSLDSGWDAFVMGAAEEAREDRFASAAEMLEVLQKLAATLKPSHAVCEETEPPEVGVEDTEPEGREDIGSPAKGIPARPEGQPVPISETDEGFRNSLGMEFVYISPGTFLMGSPEGEPGRRRNETQHEVKLTTGFYLQTTPVTQGVWEQVMGDNPAHFMDGGADCPVECVSWHDVQAFIETLNHMERAPRYRLPTEAEWEYACRAGSKSAYCYGDDPAVLSDYAWFDANARKRTHTVAGRRPNAWGLHDMHGNVWEWCADWHGPYPSEPVIGPTGPRDGVSRVVRGGSWNQGPFRLRCADRSRDAPRSRFRYIGFRLAADL